MWWCKNLHHLLITLLLLELGKTELLASANSLSGNALHLSSAWFGFKTITFRRLSLCPDDRWQQHFGVISFFMTKNVFAHLF